MRSIAATLPDDLARAVDAEVASAIVGDLRAARVATIFARQIPRPALP